MKRKISVLTLLAQLFLFLQAHSQKTFHLGEETLKLVSICEQLSADHHLKLSYSPGETALQKEVKIKAGEYTIESLFNVYFRPYGVDYKQLGDQLVVYVVRNNKSGKGKKDKVSFAGYVSDVATGERLQGATIVVVEQQLGTSSNNYGFYSVTTGKGTANVIVNYVGYQPIYQEVDFENDTTISFQLAPAPKTLTSVTVTGSKAGSVQNSVQMSTIDMPASFIKAMPKLLGETDVFRALQFLPGVMAGSEASSGLYVRGGSPDQNLILLDGVPVYNATHLFGIFSVFNADALQNVQIFKGGFPARYGGRLSSVIDIRMKEGNKNAWHGEGGIGLLSSSLTVEGPLSKGRSSVIVSGRTTNWKPLIALLSNSGNGGSNYKSKATYGFYDLSAKANFYLTQNDHLFISGYFGRDKFREEDSYNSMQYRDDLENGIKWGNATAVARWNHQFSKKVFSNTTIDYSQYRYTLYNKDETIIPGQNVHDLNADDQTSNLQDYAVKFDMDIIPGLKHYIRTGISATQHFFDPGRLTSLKQTGNIKQDTIIGNRRVAAKELDAYIEDEVSLLRNLKADIGLHATAFLVNSKLYKSLQPRISMRYMLNERFSAKASFVRMSQYIHLLANSGIGLPTDLWVPVTEKIPDQKSIQYAAGLAYTTPGNIELTLEGYWKHMDNVLEYKEGSFFTNIGTNWEERVVTGAGKTYGIELMARKTKGKTTGFVSYTFSHAERNFSDLNNGKPFLYHYDRPHDLKLVLEHKLSSNKELSLDWMLSSGQPATVPVQGYVDNQGNEVVVYTDRNAYRLPVYHRADVSITFNKQKKKYLRSWIIGIYNVYNRHNPFFIDLENGTMKQFSLLPILPSVSWRFKF